MAWTDTARLTTPQRSSERILSFEYINLGYSLAKVSLITHTREKKKKKSNVEAPEAVISAPLLTFGRISISSACWSLGVSFPVCSPKVPHVCTCHGVAPRLSYQEVLAHKAPWAGEGSGEGTSQHPPSSSSFHPPHSCLFRPGTSP